MISQNKTYIFTFLTGIGIVYIGCIIISGVYYKPNDMLYFFLTPSPNVNQFSCNNTTNYYIYVNHTCDSIYLKTFSQSTNNRSKLTQINSFESQNKTIYINNTYQSGKYYLFIGGIHLNSSECYYTLKMRFNRSSFFIYSINRTINENYFFQSVKNWDHHYKNVYAQIFPRFYHNSSSNVDKLNGQVCGRLAKSSKQITSYQNTHLYIYSDDGQTIYFQPFESCFPSSTSPSEIVFVRQQLKIQYKQFPYIIVICCSIYGPIFIICVIYWICYLREIIRRRRQRRRQRQFRLFRFLQWENRRESLVDQGVDQGMQYSPLQRSQIRISCSICLQNNCDSALPCFHLFHQICIKTWLSKRSDCPMCRKTYRIPDIMTEIMG